MLLVVFLLFEIFFFYRFRRIPDRSGTRARTKDGVPDLKWTPRIIELPCAVITTVIITIVILHVDLGVIKKKKKSRFLPVAMMMVIIKKLFYDTEPQNA